MGDRATTEDEAELDANGKQLRVVALSNCAGPDELPVAQASSPASCRTVPVRVPAESGYAAGGGTPPKLAAGTAALRALPDVLKLPPISHHGNVNEIIGKFGGPDQLRTAVNQLQSLLYAA